MRRLAPVALALVLFVPCAGAWTWPVRGPLLETFSFDQAHPYTAGQHRGIAIGADNGAPVLAPAGGIVSFAGTVASNGKTVTIETSAGLAVSLTHLGSLGVKKDDAIAEGDEIGTAGASGTVEFDVPYVHLGIRDVGNPQGYLDPLSFLPVAGPPVAPPPPSPPAELPAPAPPAATPAPVAPPVSAPKPVERPVPVASAPGIVVENPAPVVEAPAAPTAVPQVPSAEAPPPLVRALEPITAPAAPRSAPAPAPSGTLELLHRPAAVPAVVRPRELAPAEQVEPSRPPLPFGPALKLHGSPAMPPAIRPAAPLHAAVRQAPVHPALESQPRTPPAAAVAAHVRIAPHVHRIAPSLAALLALTAAVGLAAIRMIWSRSPSTEGATAGREDPRRAGVAVREWAAPHRPRGGLRRAGRRVRALSPAQGQRRPHGERDGRARDARDGL